MAVDLIHHFSARRDELLALARALVERESPTLDAAAAAAVTAEVASRLEASGAAARLHQTASGPHLTARVGGGDASDAPVLLLGHLDTVWPLGTLRRRPFRVEGGRAHGPGILDMKSGVAVLLGAIGAIGELGLAPSRPIKVLLTCDEESGSESSRDLIDSEATGCAAVLVLEPPLPGGRAKTERKGVARYELHIRGVAAHAGLAPERGRSAVTELAHQLLTLDRLNDPGTGVSVNAGVVRGGTFRNVVAAEASAEIDVRFKTAAQAREIGERIASLVPVLEGTRLEVKGGIDRPPLERTPGVVALFHHARAIAADLGFALGEGSTGGGSDGSLTAALGIPTLDGLGVDGDGAHAEHEHILLDDLPRRAALLTALLTRPWGEAIR